MSKTRVPEQLLLTIEKPIQYVGNEINSVHKDIKNIDVHFALCFPDTYEIGMSHLGLSILYNIINEEENFYCERVFSPMRDMEKLLIEEDIPLFSLESQTEVNKFDMLGFTIQYEMSYSNILNVLKLSNMEIRTENRKETDPIVCAGGPCVYNPEPLAPFIDFFYIGEGEAVLVEILDKYKKLKSEKGTVGFRDKFLKEIAKLKGIYVPKFYDVSYNEDGTIKEMLPNVEEAPEKVEKNIIMDLDKVKYAKNPIIPFLQPVHDRVVLEVFRGCSRGCRFCQAGFIYRPVREKSLETLKEQADHLVEQTGHDEISLVSLSTSDYSDLSPLCDYLIDDVTKQYKTNLSLPSLRIDSFSLDLMHKIQDVKKSSLTFAPEAGSQRMRDVINKGITEEQILYGSKEAFKGGWNRIKLYFMLGLPNEQEEDVTAICDLGQKVVNEYFSIPKPERAKGAFQIVVSTSFFIPKPFTPFQWAPQNTYKEFMEKQNLVNKNINKKRIRYNCHDAKQSVIEGVLARGDRKLADVIEYIHKHGASFCSWSECFDYKLYAKAMEEVGLDIDFYAARERSFDEILPWDFIDIGVSKKFFIKEYNKSKESAITVNCLEGCGGCGANKYNGGICIEDKN